MRAAGDCLDRQTGYKKTPKRLKQFSRSPAGPSCSRNAAHPRKLPRGARQRPRPAWFAILKLNLVFMARRAPRPPAWPELPGRRLRSRFRAWCGFRQTLKALKPRFERGRRVRRSASLRRGCSRPRPCSAAATGSRPPAHSSTLHLLGPSEIQIMITGIWSTWVDNASTQCISVSTGSLVAHRGVCLIDSAGQSAAPRSAQCAGSLAFTRG